MPVPTNGVHAAHDVAIAAHELRHAIRRLAEDQSYPDPVGLATLADVADAVAAGTDRYWWFLRPLLEADDAR